MRLLSFSFYWASWRKVVTFDIFRAFMIPSIFFVSQLVTMIHKYVFVLLISFFIFECCKSYKVDELQNWSLNLWFLIGILEVFLFDASHLISAVSSPIQCQHLSPKAWSNWIRFQLEDAEWRNSAEVFCSSQISNFTKITLISLLIDLHKQLDIDSNYNARHSSK